MIVGRPERGDIAFPQLARFTQTSLTPGETLATELHDQQIGYQACMPAVAIWKWSNLGQTMMKADGDFVRRVTKLINAPIGVSRSGLCAIWLDVSLV